MSMELEVVKIQMIVSIIIFEIAITIKVCFAIRYILYLHDGPLQRVIGWCGISVNQWNWVLGFWKQGLTLEIKKYLSGMHYFCEMWSDEIKPQQNVIKLVKILN